jgi:hypothetical protein
MHRTPEVGTCLPNWAPECRTVRQSPTDIHTESAAISGAERSVVTAILTSGCSFIAGSAVAIVSGRRDALEQYSLRLIEHGEQHEIQNTGRSGLKTLNFYSPPRYTKGGDESPPAKP